MKKKIKIFSKVFLAVFIILVIILFFTKKKAILIQQNSTFVSKSIRNSTNYPIKTKCSPIISAKHFSVVIDGVEYPKQIPLYQNKSINFKCLNSSKNIKTILMWNKFNGLPHIKYPFGVKKPFELFNCPVTNCELTNNRASLDKSSLVLFHLRNNIDYIPSFTNQNQRFVHVIFESPVHCHKCLDYVNKFNLSVGYTIQSDFVSTYFTNSGLYWDLNEKFNSSKDYQADKIGLAVAMISSCNEYSSSRTEYINELKKYINVDTFGKCGTSLDNECGSKSTSNIDCREYLSRKYYFFLSFENSICNGYITEKFFNTLRYDILLVTLGMGNYADYIPKQGYINALDYKTPKDLADYLMYLSKNKTAYNEYFKWKKYVKFLEKNTNLENVNQKITYKKNKLVLAGFLCEMCIKLHLESMTNQFLEKRIGSFNSMYSLKENCYGALPGQFNYVKGENIRNSFYMSPED